MALADSVPGVSGGTVAFLLGFYDKFVGSLDDLISGTKEKRIAALKYLVKLGIGWAVGFILAVLILANVFEMHIYQISSLFMGFIVFAIPIVIMEEKNCLKGKLNRSFMVVIGVALVSAITYFNHVGGSNGMDLSHPGILLYLYVFICGAIAICAMILPGISESTLLLILRALPSDNHSDKGHSSAAFKFSADSGSIRYRRYYRNYCHYQNYQISSRQAQSGNCIPYNRTYDRLTLYAIIMETTTLDVPQAPLSLNTFSILSFLIGGAVIFGMQFCKVLYSNPEKIDEEKAK